MRVEMLFFLVNAGILMLVGALIEDSPTLHIAFLLFVFAMIGILIELLWEDRR